MCNISNISLILQMKFLNGSATRTHHESCLLSWKSISLNSVQSTGDTPPVLSQLVRKFFNLMVVSGDSNFRAVANGSMSFNPVINNFRLSFPRPAFYIFLAFSFRRYSTNSQRAHLKKFYKLWCISLKLTTIDGEMLFVGNLSWCFLR